MKKATTCARSAGPPAKQNADLMNLTPLPRRLQPLEPWLAPLLVLAAAIVGLLVGLL